MNTITKIPVEYWNSTKYNPDGDAPNIQYEMEVDDQRETGQLYANIADPNGKLEDMFPVTLEVNRLPESDPDLPCVHVHFDESNLAFSMFKLGDKIIIRPETEVRFARYLLPNGEWGWIVE